MATAGSAVISPQAPVVLGCGKSRDPEGRIHDDVECNALVLRSEDECVVLITVDALYVGPVLRRYVEAHFSNVLAPRQIFMAASHAHSAPQLDTTKPALGLPNPKHLDRVCRIVVDLVARLLSERGEEVRVLATRYRSGLMVNRRKRRLIGGAEGRVVFNDVVAAPNPRATGDQYGHLVTFESARGPVAFVWQLPCHPTNSPAGRGVSADYPGVGRAALRYESESVIPVLFMQGFSGDLRPPVVSRPRGVVARARQLVLGKWFATFSEEDYARWATQVADELALVRGDASVQSASVGVPRLRVMRDCVPLSWYHEGTDKGREFSVHAVQVDGVLILGVSAEPVSAYADSPISQPSALVIPVGCIDDVAGYAPTTEVLNDGGYEGSRFAKQFAVGPPRGDYEQRLRAQFDRLTVLANHGLR